MDKSTLDKILEDHKLWLKDEGGSRADLRKADLRKADLRWADLRWADLREADLKGADLRWADLKGADLKGADLREADLDYSAWTLGCNTASSEIKVCKKLKAQLMYHAFVVSCDEGCPPVTEEQKKFIEENFHRYNEVEKLK